MLKNGIRLMQNMHAATTSAEPRIIHCRDYPSQGLSITGTIHLRDYPSQGLSISGIIHLRDYPSQGLSITGISHHRDYPSQGLSITGIIHHRDYPSQGLSISTPLIQGSRALRVAHTTLRARVRRRRTYCYTTTSA